MTEGPVREKVRALIDALWLFCDSAGEAYMNIEQPSRPGVEPHVEVIALRSSEGRRVLIGKYLREYGVAPSRQGLTEGIDALEASARGAVLEVGLRVMWHKDGLALDLGDPDWTRVIVTPNGWRLDQQQPLFRRGVGTEALPRPQPGRDLSGLRQFVNVADDQDFMLLCGWLVYALRPDGPYPVLVLQGEQGSCKSTLARVLVSLVDPSVAPLISAPRDESQLTVLARARHVLALDNLSRIDDGLKNSLCRLATGAGHMTRRLYSDSEVVAWRAARPVILTGIDNLLVADDLTDRAVVLTLPAVPEERRRREAEFMRDFERARPFLLGALLDAVAMALRDSPSVKLPGLPRMADFAQWAAASAPAFASNPQAFLTAYLGNRQSAVESGLEASPLARALREFVEERVDWTGTYGDLLRDLTAGTDEALRESPGFPRSPRGLLNGIRRLAPALRSVGVEVAEEGRTRAGSRVRVARRDGGAAGDGGERGSNSCLAHSLLPLPSLEAKGPSPQSRAGAIVTLPSSRGGSTANVGPDEPCARDGGLVLGGGT